MVDTIRRWLTLAAAVVAAAIELLSHFTQVFK
jgi:hypothetical protein